METLTLQEVAKAVGGSLRGNENLPICGASTDTRQIVSGDLFIPIRGERFDGHDFIETAWKNGAAAVLTERPNTVGKAVVTVPDTREAYLRLAAYYRRRFPVTVVGITGSVGKTTTKEMIAAVLESKYKTLKTEGNFNNEIGLPRTLLRLDSSYQAAVIEMGMSHFGEIGRLSKCAAPNIGVITNIGVSHIENLGSRSGILKAKLEILEGMDSRAPLVLNVDNDLLAEASVRLNRDMITYGIDNAAAEIRAVDIIEQNLKTEFDILYFGKTVHAVLPTVGRHNVLNALAAFSVGVAVETDPEKAAASLQNYSPAGMRQRIVTRNGCTVIEDCYNASPDSMKAALGVLSELACTGRRIAVLADMLELGEYSRQAHLEVGAEIAQSKADLLFCTGTEAEYIAAGAKENGLTAACYMPDRDAFAAAIKEALRPGDCLLFKASRGMKLEEIIDKIFGDKSGEEWS